MTKLLNRALRPQSDLGKLVRDSVITGAAMFLAAFGADAAGYGVPPTFVPFVAAAALLASRKLRALLPA